jgi:hypothetical protein
LPCAAGSRARDSRPGKPGAGQERQVLIPAMCVANMLREGAILLIRWQREGTKVMCRVHNWLRLVVNVAGAIVGVGPRWKRL